MQLNRLADATRLLGEGADPNARHPAFSLSDKAQIYYFGVTHKIKTPDWRHLDDMNPRWSVLQIAVMLGNADMVSVLLSKGADVRYSDKQGDTALKWSERTSSMPATPFGNTRDYPRVAKMIKAAAARRTAPQPPIMGEPD